MNGARVWNDRKSATREIAERIYWRDPRRAKTTARSFHGPPSIWPKNGVFTYYSDAAETLGAGHLKLLLDHFAEIRIFKVDVL